MEVLGILIAILALMFLAYRGFHIIPTSIFAAIIVILTNGLGVWDGINGAYMAGLKGFTGVYGLVLLFGAIFGQIIGDTGSAKSISYKIIDIVGTKRVLL